MNTILYTRQNFDQDIDRIVEQIGNEKFDLIVGLTRGGCIPAVVLSHKLNIPATMLNFSTRDNVTTDLDLYKYFENLSEHYHRILIVDDLVDSGKTIQWIITTSSIFCLPSLATLLHNTDVKIGIDHYYGLPFSRSIEKRYFDFWWEI